MVGTFFWVYHGYIMGVWWVYDGYMMGMCLSKQFKWEMEKIGKFLTSRVPYWIVSSEIKKKSSYVRPVGVYVRPMEHPILVPMFGHVGPKVGDFVDFRHL